MERSTVVVVLIVLLQVTMQSHASEVSNSSSRSSYEVRLRYPRNVSFVDRGLLQTVITYKQLWQFHTYLQNEYWNQKATIWELRDKTYLQDEKIKRLKVQLKKRDRLIEEQREDIQELSEYNIRSPYFP